LNGVEISIPNTKQIQNPKQKIPHGSTSLLTVPQRSGTGQVLNFLVFDLRICLGLLISYFEINSRFGKEFPLNSN